MFLEFDQMLNRSQINVETFQCEFCPGQFEFALRPTFGIEGPDMSFQFKEVRLTIIISISTWLLCVLIFHMSDFLYKHNVIILSILIIIPSSLLRKPFLLHISTPIVHIYIFKNYSGEH